MEKSSKLEDKLRDLRFEHDPKWASSEKAPDMALSARLISIREGEQLEKERSEPVTLVDLSVRELRFSIEKR